MATVGRGVGLRVACRGRPSRHAEGTYNWAAAGPRSRRPPRRHGIELVAERPHDAEVGLVASRTPPTGWRYAPRNPKPVRRLHDQRWSSATGPSGSFWTANPSVQKQPIRTWQLFNEQMADFFWATRPWPQSYTTRAEGRLQGDPQGGPRRDGRSPARSSPSAAPRSGPRPRQLYKAGAKRYFDALAVHPFTNNEGSVAGTIDNMLTIVKKVRAVMKRNHDGRKEIFLTEFTWPAALGQGSEQQAARAGDHAEGPEDPDEGRLQGARRSSAASCASPTRCWFSWATALRHQIAAGRRRATASRVSPAVRGGTCSRGCRSCGRIRNSRPSTRAARRLPAANAADLGLA